MQALLSPSITHIQSQALPPDSKTLEPSRWSTTRHTIQKDVLQALEVMQDKYFDIFSGTWPSSIDWTAAVLGTQISATLATMVSSLELTAFESCSSLLSWQNTIDKYFAQTSVFYFGENAFGLRNQAFDDMLWGGSRLAREYKNLLRCIPSSFGI